MLFLYKKLKAFTIPLAVVVIFLIMEISIRFFVFGLDALIYPGRYTPRANVLTKQVVAIDDPILPYRLRANVQTWFKGAPLSTNKWGFRNPPIKLEKSKGLKRIAVLGASVTTGAGVSDTETYSYQLQQMLNQAAPAQFEVINVSVPGYRSNQIRAFYERFVTPFKPDYILYPIAYNGHAGLNRLVKPKYRSLEERFPDWDNLRGYLVDSFFYTAAQSYIGNYLKGFISTDWRVRDRKVKSNLAKKMPTSAVLSDFVEDRRLDGIPVILIALHRIDEVPADKQKPFAKRLQDWSQPRSGVWLIDTIPWLKGKITEADNIYPGDNHPNARVHKLYAETIVNPLLKLFEKFEKQK